MILHEPLKISARLLPAVQVADAWISFDGNFYFYLKDGREFVVAEYNPGTCPHESEEEQILCCFDGLFSFISAAIDSHEYERLTGRSGDCSNLFEPDLLSWMVQNRDQLEDMQCCIVDRLEVMEAEE